MHLLRLVVFIVVKFKAIIIMSVMFVITIMAIIILIVVAIIDLKDYSKC